MKTVFTQKLAQLRQVHLLEECVEQKSPAVAVGLSSVHKANLLLALWQKGRQMVVVTEDEQNAQRLCADFNKMAGDQLGAVFPDRDLNIRPVETVSQEYTALRLRLLSRLAEQQLAVVFCSVAAACSYTLPPALLRESVLRLQPGQEIPQQRLLEQLAGSGYERCAQIEGAGQFAVRGGIVDIFPVSEAEPVRLEYWGDEIDSLSRFDLDSQRRTDTLAAVSVYPASELLTASGSLAEKVQQLRTELGETPADQQAGQLLDRDIRQLQAGLGLSNLDKYLPLIYPHPSTLLDYLDDPVVAVSEWAAVKQAGTGGEQQWQEDMKLLLEEGELCRGLSNYRRPFAPFWQWATGRALFLESFARAGGDIRPKQVVNFNAVQLASWSGELRVLTEELEAYRDQRVTVVVMGGTDKASRALAADLSGAGIPASVVGLTHTLEEGGVYILPGSLSAGFEYPEAKFAVLTHGQVQTVRTRKRKKRKGEEIRSLSDLTPGDLVVHVSHGIGCFEGIQKLSVQGIEKDYIKLRYAGTDTLYVPVTQLDLVSKYIGSDDGHVRLNKLGGDGWQNTRKRVKKAVAEMAKELIQLYAEREKSVGYAFSPDNDWMRGFEQHFEYEETDDQLRAIAEIKEDMERPRPMDRLLCGDVGFGKTEVALRAAFKCVLDGKQCALLCPTTILAWQHYQNTLARMGDYPVSVELLSRFRTPRQQKEILRKLKAGEIELVIGTHRLVQKDVEFKDLGLAIVDEEQRFGVAQKERFKEIFRGVDVLSLSATPIPRTLNMAMSGIRDMSVLEEPPQDRQPIQTYVVEYNAGILAEAIRRELRRNGQVYYIHNRIDSIHSCAARVQKMAPNARIGVAHGRMSEQELSDIWRQLMEHDLDILVCTTIIETGVDLPNVNTLIIEQADYMGLSQLYQLRGRVGRSKRRAFAYFTFAGGKVLTEIAAKRLSAIREFTRFGSGFRIALRDLEIRGAGSLLGEKQHGQMEAVGYDMYIRILNEAIGELQGKRPETSMQDCAIDLPVPAHIPEDYIENLSQRLDVYRKIAALRTEEDRLDLTDELIDRFGEPPKPVMGLMEVALLRARAAELGFVEISAAGGQLRFYPAYLDMAVASDLIARLGKRASLNAGGRPYIAIALQKQNPLEVIRQVLSPPDAEG